MKRKNQKIKCWAIVILGLIITICLATFAQLGAPRSSKAKLYNDECLVQPISNPLNDCERSIDED